VVVDTTSEALDLYYRNELEKFWSQPWCGTGDEAPCPPFPLRTNPYKPMWTEEAQKQFDMILNKNDNS
jgi:hypothetical protein